MTVSNDALIEWIREQARTHEWRIAADNEWWHGYVAALRDVLDHDLYLRQPDIG